MTTYDFNTVWVYGGKGQWGSKIMSTLKNLGQHAVAIDPVDELSGGKTIEELYTQIGDNDPIIIATPHDEHYNVFSKFINRPNPVLIEKPCFAVEWKFRHLRSTVTQLYDTAINSVIEDQKTFGRKVVMVGHLYRYNRGFNIVTEYMGQHKDEFFHTFSFEKYGCHSNLSSDIIYTIGIHDIYTLMYLSELSEAGRVVWNWCTDDRKNIFYSSLIGDTVASVSSLDMKSYKTDTSELHYFMGETSVRFDWNTHSPIARRSLKISGDNYMIVWDDVAQKVELYECVYTPKKMIWNLIERTSYAHDPTPLEIELSTFLDCAYYGLTPPTTLDDAKVIEEIIRSFSR